MAVVKPVLQALVLAERIYSDVTGRKIIAGTFNTYLTHKTTTQPAPPGPVPSGQQIAPFGVGDPGSPSLYISLTDVAKGTQIEVRFQNISKNEVMFGVNLTLDCNDRLAIVEANVMLPPLHKLPNFTVGTYSIDVLWNGEILGSHRIIVQEAPPTTIPAKDGA